MVDNCNMLVSVVVPVAKISELSLNDPTFCKIRNPSIDLVYIKMRS